MEGSVLFQALAQLRECTVAGSGAVMEGSVLFQALAQL